ncbi:AAA family ATPase [Candidatus Saccharibacteria bacterium]|nr:AAA family ATPase [Candidatus Saccharibacteria bacterium]
MSKLTLNKPTLIMLYGFPGSGKTFIARQLCEDLNAAHVQGDRIRHELFEKPRYDKQENEVVSHLMEYMAEEFLNAGMSVVYDTNAARIGQRRALRDLARKVKAISLLTWIQIDAESSFTRSIKRDRRRSDDKYTPQLDRTTFDSLLATMQNPTPTEEFMVISGKHSYQTQRSAIVKRLFDLGLITPDVASNNLAKPGLVNLVPNPMGGRVDNSRRNIVIR